LPVPFSLIGGHNAKELGGPGIIGVERRHNLSPFPFISTAFIIKIVCQHSQARPYFHALFYFPF
jgi:hypothetical protein